MKLKNNMTISEELTNFLKSKRVYTKFCKEVNADKDWDDEALSGHELSDIIYSLTWNETEDGFDYWSKLSDEFEGYCD